MKTTMSKVLKSLVCAMVLVLVPAPLSALPSGTSSLIDTLEFTLSNFDRFRENRASLLHDLKGRRSAASGRERVDLGERIAKEYILSDIDSAMLVYQIVRSDARAMADSAAMRRIDMQIAALMPTMGVIKEAIENFEVIDPATLPAELRKPYWRSAAELYHCALNSYPEGSMKEKYKQKTLVAIDSLRHYYPVDSPLSNYFLGYINMLSGDTNLAVANFMEALPNLSVHPEIADFAMMMIASYYEGRPGYEHIYRDYTLRRAINALRRGLLRSKLYAEVGSMLFESGYEDLGRRFVSLSIEMPDRSYSGYYDSVDRSRIAHIFLNDSRELTHTRIVFVVTLLLIAVIMLLLYFRLRVKIRESHDRLAELQHNSDVLRREATLTNQSLITLAFVAIEELKEYNLHVSRKLKTGQVKDLIQEVESGKHVSRQSAKFFEVFDATFLSDFPGFVAALNKLLLPDRQLELLPGDRLSPELRIAAFMRLGVSDSNRLSQVLGLSLNTIYTYRNRLKGRALNRETFEQDVASIHSDA
ncbi:MAG: DUF6377 domain-containing protein [Muribaculaceae bacterium]|nr:DUF6377 domain-containing protein [Muribaculaceae bacterium]